MKTKDFYEIVCNELSKINSKLRPTDSIRRIRKGICVRVNKIYNADTDCVISFIYQIDVRMISNQAYYKQNADGTFRELLQIKSPLSKTGQVGLIDTSVNEQWFFNDEILPKGRLVQQPYKDTFIHRFYKNEN